MPSLPSQNSGLRGLVAAVLLCLAASGSGAAATPIDAPAAGPALPTYLGILAPGTLTSGIPTLSDPTQTWELYLPKSFTPDRKWPVLVLFDPRKRGKFAAELFRDAADEFGWVLASSNNTLSDGPGDPNTPAVNAMMPDIMRRLPIDPQRIYAGGFSGGAILAWLVGVKGNYLAGVISIGGRPVPELARLVPKFAFFAAAGEADFNYVPTFELDRIAAKAGVPHRLETFPGPHSWCPAETARRAVRWLELLAMRDGLAPRREAILLPAFAEEVAAATLRAQAGEALAAGRRFDEIADTFRGLAPLVPEDEVRQAALRAAELLASPGAKRSLKQEQDLEKFESMASRRIGEAADRLRTDENPTAPGELRHILGLDDLLRRREAGGAGGAAAVRVLASLHAQLSHYLANEFFAADDYRRAVPGLRLAAELFPGDTFTLYNLACAEARSGQPDAALDHLSRALDHGLSQPSQMATDADLASLRERPEFALLLARAREADAARATGPAPP